MATTNHFDRTQGKDNNNISEINETCEDSFTNVDNIPETKIPKQPKTDGYYLDLSQCDIKTIPILYLDHDIRNEKLALLYLSENKLSELPDALFHCYPNLTWLDVRNNNLQSIPKTIKFHPKLETLLVQGNQICILPPELGTVPNLITLQLSNNPITYPESEVINKGTEKVLEFLHDEFKQLNPEYAADCLRKDNDLKLKSRKIMPKKKSQQSMLNLISKKLSQISGMNPAKNSSEYLKRLSEVSFDVTSPIEVNQFVNPVNSVEFPVNGMAMLKDIVETENAMRRKHNCHTKGNKIVLGNEIVIEDGRLNLKTKNTKFIGRRMANANKLRIATALEKLLRDILDAKTKDRKLFINQMLKIRNDVAVRDKFRKQYRMKSYQSSLHHHKDYKHDNPYGTDPEYEKVLSRAELNYDAALPYKIRDAKQIRRLPPKRINFNKEILSMLNSLEKITLNGEVGPPEVVKSKLYNDIARISEIQKSLAALKLENDRRI